MIESGGITPAELEEKLIEAGYRQASFGTESGTLWAHADTGAVIQIPYPSDDYYPDWLLAMIPI